MLKKLALLVVALLGLTVAPLGASAHAEAYGAKIPTVTHIKVLTAVNGKPIVFQVWTTADTGQPTGDIAVTVSRGGVARGAQAAGDDYSTTVHFSGSPVTVHGQVLHKGQYLIGASFTPDNRAVYLPSDATMPVGVDALSVNSGGSPSSGGPAGLPGTGGPSVWLLVLGVALAGGGLVLIRRSRVTA